MKPKHRDAELIEEIGLPFWAFLVCVDLKIITFGQLRRTSDAVLREQRGIGKKRLAQLRVIAPYSNQPARASEAIAALTHTVRSLALENMMLADRYRIAMAELHASRADKLRADVVASGGVPHQPTEPTRH